MKKIPKAIFVLHRHGQRAPAKNIYIKKEGPVAIESEKTLWKQLCSNFEDKLNFFNIRYPIDVHLNQTNEASDGPSFPFGNITDKGILFLEDKGRKLVERFPVLRERTLNTVIRSTNYRRTQISAQSFIYGLKSQTASSQPIKIFVDEPEQCCLSFFDRNSKVANAALKKIQSQPEFIALEKQTEPLQLSLIHLFPSLEKKSLTSNSNSVNIGSKLDWMAAFDYFTCRRAHAIPTLNEAMQYEEQVLRAVTDRFHMYMSDREYTCNFMGIWLSQVVGLIKNDIRNSSNEVKLRIFSGHDINILAVMYLLRAESLVSGNKKMFWPDFGAVLQVVVYDVNDIHILLDDEIIPIVWRGNVYNTLSLEQLEYIYEDCKLYLK